MKEFGKRAVMIDPAIKRYIAALFVKDAATRHAIAFFQWRRAFCASPLSTKEDIQSVIDNRLGGREFRAVLSKQKLQQYQQEQAALCKK